MFRWGIDLKQYMYTLASTLIFPWVFSTALIGQHTLLSLIIEDIKTLSDFMILQLCIDVLVQRLGDATAAGIYELLFGSLSGRTSSGSIYALPVCTCYFWFPPFAFSFGWKKLFLPGIDDTRDLHLLLLWPCFLNCNRVIPSSRHHLSGTLHL